MTGQAARPGRHCFSFRLWFAGDDFESRGEGTGLSGKQRAALPGASQPAGAPCRVTIMAQPPLPPRYAKCSNPTHNLSFGSASRLGFTVSVNLFWRS